MMISLPAEELAEKITRAGIEVDAVIDRSQGMTNVVVGHVVSKEKHPEADKLNVCQVDVGEEELQQIVCGAPNVDAGQKVIVARSGGSSYSEYQNSKAQQLLGHDTAVCIISCRQYCTDSRSMAGYAGRVHSTVKSIAKKFIC